MTSRTALASLLLLLSASSAPGQQPTPHTYVIVHGAWGGGWDWKPVDSLLTAAGNRVYRPTLTGLGERSHLATPATDLSTHITDIVNVIKYENLHDIVLVGHSYGGMVITGVADRVPDRIRRLVYLDAFLPENGESVLTATSPRRQGFVRTMLDSAKNELLTPVWVKPGTPPPIDVPQPKKTFTEVLTLTNPASKAIPGTYILTVEKGKPEADDDFASFAQRAKSRGFTYVVLQSDHTPERSAKKELVEILRRVP